MTLIYNGKDIIFINIKLVDNNNIHYDHITDSFNHIDIQHYTDTLRIRFNKNERIINNNFINDLEVEYK